jgi:hypothetical protein
MSLGPFTSEFDPAFATGGNGGGLIPLTGLRDAVALVLAPASDADPYVFADVVDSLTPPALVVEHGDPFLVPGIATRPTIGQCDYTARLAVVCIAGRLEPGPGMDTLERLETYVLERMRGDRQAWVLEEVSQRGQYDLAGITYLAATVTYTITTTL